MRIDRLENMITAGQAVQMLSDMYGPEEQKNAQKRFIQTAQEFIHFFGEKDFTFFSSPARTEIIGNHTDHNGGKVLAVSIQLDCLAAAAPNGLSIIRIISCNHKKDKPLKITIHLDNLSPGKKFSGSAQLLKGVIYKMQKSGYRCGGFDAYIDSTVPGGSGLSSSASFEMLICAVIDYFFNKNSGNIENWAKCGMYAENVYWKKSSGLMDQLACAHGGITQFDFKDPASVAFSPVLTDGRDPFRSMGLSLVIVPTGSSHASLNKAYSSITEDMLRVSEFFDKSMLCHISEEDVIRSAPDVRKSCGDRALLRALHFFEENKRVSAASPALRSADRQKFLSLIRASGDSSWKWLQNCYLPEHPRKQNIPSILALTELFISSCCSGNGACRVHGGGFAGVIAAYIPEDKTDTYLDFIAEQTGGRYAFRVHIRPWGTGAIPFSQEHC